ncbi:MAG: formyltransferase family protein [Methylocystis sp.]
MAVAIMADGPVGRDIVAFVLSHHAHDLSAVAVTDAGVHAEEIAALCAKANVATLRWSERRALLDRKPDVLLLAWWPYLLKNDDLNLAPVILNTHPSLLPYCRGKDPNFWALAEASPYGVTIHHVVAQIDAGPIAFQKEIEVDWEDTGASLYRSAEHAMVELVEESWRAIRDGEIPQRSQDIASGSFHKRAELESASRIDLDAPTTGRALLNRLRARTFAPHPACRFEDQGVAYEVRVEIKRLLQGDEWI